MKNRVLAKGLWYHSRHRLGSLECFRGLVPKTSGARSGENALHLDKLVGLRSSRLGTRSSCAVDDTSLMRES